METVNEQCLEWALKHLQKFNDSDFFPKLFEFKAIANDWANVKAYIMGLDLDNYVPNAPRILLAPKANANYRIAHQLDPIDSLIYTALVYEICKAIEKYRIPTSRKIACSYRIDPDINGSFFPIGTNGWNEFTAETEELSKRFADGWALITDITDFYNQIYIHRIRNIIAEAGEGKLDSRAKHIERFLLGLNDDNSRGIPVRPAASIILAEAIMADIDNKILRITPDFVRYVDDVRIFFATREEALNALHELTEYIHSRHRLVFAGDKTRILPTQEFVANHFKNEEREVHQEILRTTEKTALAKIESMLDDFSPYGFDGVVDDATFNKVYEQVAKEKQFAILSKTYLDMFNAIISKDTLDTALLRHILRKATTYRIRALVDGVLDNFERLLPLIREAIVYLNKVQNLESVVNNTVKLKGLSESPHYSIPFVNTWITSLYEHPYYNNIDLPSSYELIPSIRSQAMIALRKKDATWVKHFRNAIGTLGTWDKRAVIFCSSLLSFDEMVNWLRPVAARGDIVEKAISSYLISTHATNSGNNVIMKAKNPAKPIADRPTKTPVARRIRHRPTMD